MIPITRLLMGEEEAQAAAEVIRSGWVAQGARVAELEARVAELVGAAHAVAVSNGTAALHLALVGLGIKPGDDVLVPSLSFPATANAVLYCGARPVFVDVDRRTYNMDPRAARAAITPRTRAIMPVHQIGLCADMDAFAALCDEHGLLLVEDAACALGARTAGGLVGAGPGHACCFSFHPRKVITTGEGGLITTSDQALAESLRVLRSQGMSLPAEVRHRGGPLVCEEYRVLGYNYRLTDIQAAIGLVQVGRLPGILAARRRLGLRYGERLAGVGRLSPPPPEPFPGAQIFQSYMVLLDEDVNRDQVMVQMHTEGVTTKRAVTATHREPLYRALYPDLSLPETEHVARHGLMLPLFPQMSDEEQDRVIQALKNALSRYN